MQSRGYEKRNANLRKMGYSSYREYLQSSLWDKIKNVVLERDKWSCRICGGWAKVVHHTRYALPDLRGEDLQFLFSLCHGCHHSVEFDGLNLEKKLHLKKVVKKTAKMIVEGKKERRKKRKGGKPWIGFGHRDKLLRRRGYL